ncbi:DegV family protein [Clostridium botulinum]|uniref:Fatty acid-binding protein DegV n=1 Tax=Clostridium botulinum TaxID=1491 RepID=A0A9Q1ZD41_CLOBO|nr:DegV family protein [Clostridium botulinum]AEB74710.1 DegV family protein, putative [Clostridium botulinum BKT015925]KEI01856.1 fatty acid-binding protein DegV [Clostridium botulinum C/D str. Sp77]KEI02744.1 fatty acid-binding protein DegV [Clostridium botulinum D str. 16868]KLU74895.1 fatty acid-binding protein DegV [Clostridium botulinum V891]KOA77064.1 fatty acid-binding protein DegV [Clostridium botulinum]
MDIKIVTDSGCDLSKELKENMNIEAVPLTLQLEDREYVDDESLDILKYIKDMAECKTAPKTACPSPQDYMESYKGNEKVFVVPLSSKLSGSYNSAVLAKNLFLEEINNKFIHVFDSVTASVGQTVIALKISELSKLNLGEIEIVEKINKYISEMKTFFLLESLDHLAKAGRLNPIIAKVANMLSIKPIMGSNDDGTIRMVEKTRGYKKAFKRFIDVIGEEGSNLEQKVLGIAHCNCLERALKFKEEVLKRYNFKDIVVVEMSGLSTTYADDGGLVIAF